eukprot:1816358-Amphidinium_carterae.1
MQPSSSQGAATWDRCRRSQGVVMATLQTTCIRHRAHRPEAPVAALYHADHTTRTLSKRPADSPTTTTTTTTTTPSK